MNLAAVQIEAFHNNDYAALTQLYNEIEPDYPSTEEEIRSWDERRDPKIKQAYFVVKDGKKMIAA